MKPVSAPQPIEPAKPLESAAGALKILCVDLEPATAELIALWLDSAGFVCDLAPQPGEAAALILVEMAFPRRSEHERLRTLAEVWPGVPVIVLSPTFFADVKQRGEVARQLGVAAVLATPLKREAFLGAMRAVLPARRLPGCEAKP